MANRFETETSFVEMHREKFLSRSSDIFEIQGREVEEGKNNHILQENAGFILYKKGSFILGTMETKNIDGDYYQYDQTIVSISDVKGPRVSLVKGERKLINEIALSRVSVKYGSLDEQGEASLINPEITVHHPGEGSHMYSTEERTAYWRSGLALLIDEDEASDALVVRVDHDAERMVFPKRFNIYERLQEVEDRLRKGGNDGK